jgi:hypothetical protein
MDYWHQNRRQERWILHHHHPSWWARSRREQLMWHVQLFILEYWYHPLDSAPQYPMSCSRVTICHHPPWVCGHKERNRYGFRVPVKNSRQDVMILKVVNNHFGKLHRFFMSDLRAALGKNSVAVSRLIMVHHHLFNIFSRSIWLYLGRVIFLIWKCLEWSKISSATSS